MRAFHLIAIALFMSATHAYGQLQARTDTVVRVAGAARYPGVATLVDAMTVGAGSTSAEYLFDVVADMLVTRSGALWVIDSPAKSPSIRIFDSSGKFVRHVGRKGDGPGEFRAPGSLAELADGRVAVRDILAHMVNIYATSGEPVATMKFATRLSGVTFSGGLIADSAGYLYVYTNMFDGPNPLEQPAPFADGGTMVRLNMGGTIVDTIARPKLPLIEYTTLSSVGIQPTRIPFYPDFTPIPSWCFSPMGYMVTGVPSRYAIDLRIPPARSPQARGGAAVAAPAWRQGDPVVSIRRNVAAVVMTNAERDDRNRRAASDLAHDHGAIVGPIPSVPRTKPAFQSIQVDRDGRIWVRVSVASERYNPPPAQYRDGTPRMTIPWREPIVFDVFEPNGTLIGSVRVPYDISLQFGAIRGNSAWVLQSDADGVASIRRMHIAWGAR